MNTITMHWEDQHGAVHDWPFHYGTNMKVAQMLVEAAFRAMEWNKVKTMALRRDGVLVAIYDGEWSYHGPERAARLTTE